MLGNVRRPRKEGAGRQGDPSPAVFFSAGHAAGEGEAGES